jgi:Putative addiction module component
MSAQAKKVIEELRLLPLEDRREVAEAIFEMDMVDGSDETAEAERAWTAELDRRARSVVDGTAELIDEDVVNAEINRLRTRKSA